MDPLLDQNRRDSDQNHRDSDDDNEPSQYHLRELESVVKCVNYVLQYMGTKYALKKSEFAKLLETGCRFDRTLPLVQKKLIDAYGLELVLVPDCGSNKEYIVVNQLPKTLKLHHQGGDDRDRKYATALLLSLSQIFMNNGASTRESLINFLNRFAMFQTENNFIEDLIDSKFRRQHYLAVYNVADVSVVTSQRSQQRTNEVSDVLKLKWGFRTEMEYTRMEILKFVAKVYDREPIFWPRLYRLAMGQVVEDEANEQVLEDEESANESDDNDVEEIV